MSAGLDALDRGLIEVGLTAAEAVARVELLERRVAELEIRADLHADRLAALWRLLPAACEAARLPVPTEAASAARQATPYDAAAAVQARRRAIHQVGTRCAR